METHPYVCTHQGSHHTNRCLSPPPTTLPYIHDCVSSLRRNDDYVGANEVVFCPWACTCKIASPIFRNIFIVRGRFTAPGPAECVGSSKAAFVAHLMQRDTDSFASNHTQVLIVEMPCHIEVAVAPTRRKMPRTESCYLVTPIDS